ncbi:MAG: hypothetical protein AAFQ63_05925 [Cyanobacteria bacterium J06621_11]
MRSQQAVLTALGCAGSLAAMLAVTQPAVAATTADVDESLPTLTQTESNPITDALRCSCARCALGEMTPSL